MAKIVKERRQLKLSFVKTTKGVGLATVLSAVKNPDDGDEDLSQFGTLQVHELVCQVRVALSAATFIFCVQVPS